MLSVLDQARCLSRLKSGTYVLSATCSTGCLTPGPTLLALLQVSGHRPQLPHLVRPADPLPPPSLAFAPQVQLAQRLKITDIAELLRDFFYTAPLPAPLASPVALHVQALADGKIPPPTAEQLAFLSAPPAADISSMERLQVMTELKYLCLLTQAVALALQPAPVQ